MISLKKQNYNLIVLGIVILATGFMAIKLYQYSQGAPYYQTYESTAYYIAFLITCLCLTCLYFNRNQQKTNFGNYNPRSLEDVIDHFNLTLSQCKNLSLATSCSNLIFLLPIYFVITFEGFDWSFFPTYVTYEEAISRVPEESASVYLSGIISFQYISFLNLILIALFLTFSILYFTATLSQGNGVQNPETKKLVIGSRILFFWALINTIPIPLTSPSGIDCYERQTSGWYCSNVYNVDSLLVLNSALLISDIVFLIGIGYIYKSKFFSYRELKGKNSLLFFFIGLCWHMMIVIYSMFHLKTVTLVFDFTPPSLYLVFGYPFLILFAYHFSSSLKEIENILILRAKSPMKKNNVF